MLMSFFKKSITGFQGTESAFGAHGSLRLRGHWSVRPRGDSLSAPVIESGADARPGRAGGEHAWARRRPGDRPLRQRSLEGAPHPTPSPPHPRAGRVPALETPGGGPGSLPEAPGLAPCPPARGAPVPRVASWLLRPAEKPGSRVAGGRAAPTRGRSLLGSGLRGLEMGLHLLQAMPDAARSVGDSLGAAQALGPGPEGDRGERPGQQGPRGREPGPRSRGAARRVLSVRRGPTAAEAQQPRRRLGEAAGCPASVAEPGRGRARRRALVSRSRCAPPAAGTAPPGAQPASPWRLRAPPSHVPGHAAPGRAGREEAVGARSASMA